MVSHFNQLDQSISVLVVVRCMVFFICIQILRGHSVSKQLRPGQTPRSVASDLGLLCLPISHKKDVRLV